MTNQNSDQARTPHKPSKCPLRGDGYAFGCTECMPRAGDQVTDLERLVDEGIYEAEPGDKGLMRKYIQKAYALGYEARRSEL